MSKIRHFIIFLSIFIIGVTATVKLAQKLSIDLSDIVIEED